ncbi:MAG: glycerophosphodiester phosphodiesterase [Acidimicrobiales bacterium]|nr:glycerophosphodiester phosphodiesterase [Acidimicrobiales bacterium]
MTRIPSLRPPVGFAHRGARARAAENTLEAFQLALRLGATGIESDVWLTADGKAVLDHDGVVGGRFRRRPIASLARRELPSHIPELADLYATCGDNFELSLDIKDPSAIAEVIATARDQGRAAESRLWVCHHEWRLLATWRELSDGVKFVHSTRLAHMEGGPEQHAATLRRAGIDAVNLHHTDWNGGRTTLFHRFGLLALAWDAQVERVLDAMLNAGIDGVYSDHVDRMMEAIDRRRAHP